MSFVTFSEDLDRRTTWYIHSFPDMTYNHVRKLVLEEIKTFLHHKFNCEYSKDYVTDVLDYFDVPSSGLTLKERITLYQLTEQ